MKKKVPTVVRQEVEHKTGICDSCLNINDKVRKPVKDAGGGSCLCEGHWKEFQNESLKLFKTDIAPFYLH